MRTRVWTRVRRPAVEAWAAAGGRGPRGQWVQRVVMGTVAVFVGGGRARGRVQVRVRMRGWGRPRGGTKHLPAVGEGAGKDGKAGKQVLLCSLTPYLRRS
jgi:hypothetical protein